MTLNVNLIIDILNNRLQMKTYLFAASFGAVVVAEETLSTIRSTIVSTLPCISSIAPSSFVYANHSTFEPLSTTYTVVDVSSTGPLSTETSSYTTNPKSTLYEYDTAYDDGEFDVTRTICKSDGYCYLTTERESSTTITTTIGGIRTVLTTVVPVEPVTSETFSISGSSEPTAAPESFTSAKSSTEAYTSATSEGASIPSSTSEEQTLTSSAVGIESSQAATTLSIPSDLYEAETSSSVPAITSASPSSEPQDSLTLEGTVTVSEKHTTTISITSCSENGCTVIPKTTGFSIVTETIGEVITSYTTYCPLSESTIKSETPSQTISQSVESEIPATSESVESKPPTTSSIVTPGEEISSSAKTTTLPLSTINVITHNIETRTSKVSSASTSAETSAISISTYEAAAAAAFSTSIAGILFSFFISLF